MYSTYDLPPIMNTSMEILCNDLIFGCGVPIVNERRIDQLPLPFYCAPGTGHPLKSVEGIQQARLQIIQAQAFKFYILNPHRPHHPHSQQFLSAPYRNNSRINAPMVYYGKELEQ
ncbi:hypothetical protein D3C71_1370610 [compost metagenome]